MREELNNVGFSTIKGQTLDLVVEKPDGKKELAEVKKFNYIPSNVPQPVSGDDVYLEFTQKQTNCVKKLKKKPFILAYAPKEEIEQISSVEKAEDEFFVFPPQLVRIVSYHRTELPKKRRKIMVSRGADDCPHGDSYKDFLDLLRKMLKA